MFVGRVREKKELLAAYEADESAFVAVYGRRRVGKTYMIRKAFEDRITFSCAGVAKGNKRQQLLMFRTYLMEAGFFDCPMFSDWFGAFSALKTFLLRTNDRKKVVFIDEISWLDTPRSDFLMALENFWNGWASARNDILLIICASATQWIVKKVLKNRGGLHNRVNLKLHVKPFTLAECQSYVEAHGLGFTRAQIVQIYMTIGGVAYYWSKLKAYESVAQSLDRLFFSEDCELGREFEEVYRSLFNIPEPYMAVVRALGKKGIGFTRDELLKAVAGSDGGGFSQILEDLENCGFIRAYAPFGKKTKDTMYQLIDPFTIFYFKFLEDRGRRSTGYWREMEATPVANTWYGLAFERVVLAHVDNIKSALGIRGVFVSCSSWRSRSEGLEPGEKGCQIDLVLDRADGIVDLIEVKWSGNEFVVSAEYDKELRHRRELFCRQTKTRKAVHSVLCAPYGVSRSGYGLDYVSISMEDLFSNSL